MNTKNTAGPDDSVRPALQEPPENYPEIKPSAGNTSLPPVAFETGVELIIRGPSRRPEEPALWTARGRVLMWITEAQDTEARWFSRAIRQLYVDRKLPAKGMPQGLLPGMLLARCRIMAARLRINGTSYHFAGPSSNPIDVNLLLQADDRDWSEVMTLNFLAPNPSVNLRQATCLAGEIPFDSFTVHRDAPPNQPDWRDQFPIFNDLSSAKPATSIHNVALSSSGIVLDAKATLPWSAFITGPPAKPQISEARYLVEVQLTPQDVDPDLTPPEAIPEPPLLVLPDLERINDPGFRQARSDYLAAFAAFAGMLKRPSGDPKTPSLPHWMILEPIDPASLPGFSWDIRIDSDGKAPPIFQFDAGAWRLVLTDQPAGLADITPRGILSTAPRLRVATDTTNSQALVVSINSPRPSSPDPKSTEGTLTYTLKPKSGGGFVESIAIENLDTVYDMFDTARFLRAIAGLPEPDLDPPANTATRSPLSPLNPVSAVSDGKVVPPVLFGVVPLEDGWAQLPFLNATEQIVADALPDRPRPAPNAVPALFAGAAVFGTDDSDLFDPSSGEPAWRISVLDARTYCGKVTLTKDGPTQATLILRQPEINLAGIFWLATGAPTPEDALPTFDNWLGPVQTFSLRTPDPADLFPPPFVVRIENVTFNEQPVIGALTNLPTGVSTAALATVEFSYAANLAKLAHDESAAPSAPPADEPTIFERLLTKDSGPYDSTEFWAEAVLPLVWRRHGRAPAIQSLPMTQSKTPPNYPSASRQLFPFVLSLVKSVGNDKVLVPGDWRFHSDNGASWPRLAVDAEPAVQHEAYDGLTLVSLGLPGLVFDPNAAPGLMLPANPLDEILHAQYHHEVALLDEVNALAMLPKDDDPNAQDGDPPPPPPGLERADYQAFWSHLADLAFSATAEARDALSMSGGKSRVGGLIEPLQWLASASFTTAPYPGRITFIDPNGKSLALAGSQADALRGIEGAFRRTTAGLFEQTDPASADFTLVGESMAAVLEKSGRMRDQRGLYREPTQVLTTPKTTWLTTRVALADDPGAAATPVLLWTAMGPLPLSATPNDSWSFWFRDLPAVDGGATSIFNRAGSDSSQRRGENNPAAMTRRLIHLNAYEWRMANAKPSPHAPDSSPLPLGPLWFYPLLLETATFDAATGLQSFVVIGRLHLPFDGNAPKPLDEPVNRGNSVRLTFVDNALTRIDPAPLDVDQAPGSPATAPAFPVNEWPLANPEQFPDTPLLRWNTIDLRKDSTGSTGVELAVQLVYVRHGVSWTLPMPAAVNLFIPWSGTVSDVTYQAADFKSAPAATVSVTGATVSLNFSSDPLKPLGHSVTAKWKFVWGDPASLRLVVTYDDPVLAPVLASGASAAPPAGTLQAQLLVLSDRTFDLVLQDIGDPPPVANLDSGGVQIQWSGLSPAASSPTGDVQILPGFYLESPPSDSSSGFGILHFEMNDQPGSVPVIDQPRGGFFEALFSCVWGAGLQSAFVAPPGASAEDVEKRVRERLFRSSSGQLAAAYTSTLQPPVSGHSPAWSPSLLLNGFVEVKNLVSWPCDLAQKRGADNLATIPAARPKGNAIQALSHVRHTARILFDQHPVPVEKFDPGDAKSGILLKLKKNEVWSIPAVVEHQFVVVELDPDPKNSLLKAANRDCRITVAQEVRFCSPSAFRAMLVELAGLMATDVRFPLSGDTILAQSPNFLLRELPDAARGYLSRDMIRLLTETPDKLVDLADDDVMIVEASAPAMVRSMPMTVKSRDGKDRVPSSLLYLPPGTVRAYLAALSDYQSIRDDATGVTANWVLLSLPFLGRTKPEPANGYTAVADSNAKGRQPSSLSTDPLLQIAVGQLSAFDSLSRLALVLANWEDREPVTIGLAEFDLFRHRIFSRLDPSSLRESWFRLSQPAPSPQSAPPDDDNPPPLQSVLANSPTDEPGTLGRPEVLSRLLDPRRLALPPDATASPTDPLPSSSSLIQWHPDSLFLLDLAGSMQLDSTVGLCGRVVAEFSFLGAGAQLERSGLLPDAPAIARYPAALILPARLSLPPRFANVQPVSTAVSPYLGFDLDPASADQTDDPVIAVSELVCFDLRLSTATTIAERSWDPAMSSADLDDLIRAWGEQTQSRFAPDSPVAVIRLREIFAKASNGSSSSAGSPDVDVLYRFLGVSQIVPPTIAIRAIALRSQTAALRSAEGQFGGSIMPPPNLARFELAPPQINGVQPLRLDNRLDANRNSLWPWGLSALRVSARLTDGSAGVAGPPLPVDGKTPASGSLGRLWWQALQHDVQYVVPEEGTIRKILPTLFRASAISAILPAWATTPLPSLGDLLHALAPASDDPSPSSAAPLTPLLAWQPVLPGERVTVIAGARPAAPFVFREFVQTQDFTTESAKNEDRPYLSVASGAVPVMHRVPRPVLLPPNDRTNTANALQPWASAFTPTVNVRVEASPVDMAYIEQPAAAGLDLVLQPLLPLPAPSAPPPATSTTSPPPVTPPPTTTTPPPAGSSSLRGGEIPKGPNVGDDWDLTLRFTADGHGSDVSKWFPTNSPATLTDPTDPSIAFTFKLNRAPAAAGSPATNQNTLEFDANDSANLKKWLDGKSHGDAATVRVVVGNGATPGSGVQGFMQSLTFPLRVNEARGIQPLPFRPQFFLFEDPEYNHRLTSTTAQSTAVITMTEVGSSPQVYNLTLSADRNEYNSTGPIHYVFFLDPSKTKFNGTDITGDIQFKKISSDGTAVNLLLVPAIPINSLPSSASAQDLTSIHIGKGLVPGDTLVLSLTVNISGVTSPTVELSVPIVAAPVTPAPEAGYALLRKTPAAPVPLVECARFAFSPPASRIELVDPDDLKQQVVRRRAVFQWTDTIRIGRACSYAIQKITTGGSTHFPNF